MLKPPLATISIAALFAIAPLAVRATDVKTAAEQQEFLAEANVKAAQQAMAEGDKQYKDKHFDVAAGEYQLAVDHLTESPLTHKLRAEALDGFARSSVRLAEQRIDEGRYDDARITLNTLLDKKYDPNNKKARQLLANLDEPGYYNPTIGPNFVAKIHDVDDLFRQAKQYYASARWDLAYKCYDEILNLDPTNKAARKGQEDVDAARERYAEEAYNETRGLFLDRVTLKWETPPRTYSNRQIVTIETPAINPHNTEYIKEKLDHIIIPQLNFRDATVADAIEFLRKKSVDLDTTETDPLRKGVNIVLKLDVTNPINPAAVPPADAGALAGAPPAEAPAGVAPAAVPAALGASSAAQQKITLNLSNIPMSAALDYITKLAGLKYKIEPYAVKIVPLSENTDILITKEYRVPPGFLSNSGAGAGLLGATPAAPAPAPGIAAAGPATPTSLVPKITAEDYLKSSGVLFPEGASANFLASSSKLVVRNTQENLDLVDQLVDILNNQQPTQVSVDSKFIDIQQSNYKELSFDYSLGTGNLGRIEYVGGNTITPTTTFPFMNIFGGGQITSGLRSGGEAINNDAIDALLNPSTIPAGEAAPATFALGGVVTAAQFQAVMRALNQRKGVDLLSSPSVTTKSGQRAVIEVVVEFRYPTEFNPPQVPNIVAGVGGVVGPVIGGGGAAGAAANFIPVTPTTPTAFETRNTGVTLEVEPVIGPDGQTIDLNLAPQVVEFDGFINYGTPIYGPPNPVYAPITAAQAAIIGIPGVAGLLHITGYSAPTIVTTNVINQPVFSTRKVTTSVTVWDGQTVIIGGLVREDVQTVEDKVPGLGDLPIIGRLFRSNVDQHIKRNLVMFVTARLINPAGELVHGENETEEEAPQPSPVEPLTLPTLPEAPLPEK